MLTKIDLNPAAGIIKTCRDNIITDVVMGWHGTPRTREVVFGSVHDTVLKDYDGTVFVARINNPLNITNKIWVVLPPNAELEAGFLVWLKKVAYCSAELSSPVNFCGTSTSHKVIEEFLEKEELNIKREPKLLEDWEDILLFLKDIQEEDLLFIVSARQGTLSYHPMQNRIPQKLARYWPDNSFIIIYPHQTMQRYKVLFK